MAGQAVLLLHRAAEYLLHAAGQHRQTRNHDARYVALAARDIGHGPADQTRRVMQRQQAGY